MKRRDFFKVLGGMALVACGGYPLAPPIREIDTAGILHDWSYGSTAVPQESTTFQGLEVFPSYGSSEGTVYFLRLSDDLYLYSEGDTWRAVPGQRVR